MIDILLLTLAGPLVLYVVWHLIALILSIYTIVFQAAPAFDTKDTKNIKVAILYTTADDFDNEACETLLQQKDIAFDLFILDDSKVAANQKRVDEWVQSRGVPVKILRRTTRVGFKSGNLNNWLHEYGAPATYPYILLADADERWPENLAKRLLDFHLAHPNYAFIQGTHLGTAKLETSFQKLLHLQVESDQVYQLPAWNYFGGVPMIGHGVILSTAIIQKLGGFPNAVSEDLAFTISLAEKNHFGAIAPHITGFEVFPTTYAAYWKRRYRWVQADTEIGRKILSSLWHSALSMRFRLALTLRELRLPLGSFYWLLLTTIAFCSWFQITPRLPLPSFFWILFLPLFFSPALGILLSKNNSFAQRMHYLLSVVFIGASTAALHVPAVLSSFRGRREFSPTGSNKVSALISNRPLIVWELISGAFFIVGGILGANLGLTAIGLAISWAPLLRSFQSSLLLHTGVICFSVILILQIILDFSSGYVPIDHLLVLTGITITLSG